MDFDDFEESEVMFSDYSSDESVESYESENSDRTWKHYSQSNASKLMVKRRVSSSVPVDIPMINSFEYDMDVSSFEPFDDDDDDDNDDDVEMMRLPPHLIVERRVNEEMARSFSPLKGKNLCEVRNSILRMTGFLER
ncbi:hypothetical protein BVRB_8g200900 [Beta vulgaris subsp. vulgaris]|uniref:Uncharacterized protein n=1 Tax=Beta vulgaris subsp. vulgaris TaxID=3555 RepID=A0A0J8B601_BETVV|nr:protein S40-2 [Beta vulgaris subsp. vulgaris]KMS96669.1 hypothetical protein BVRB_8g200900 [Beta vulgaris subsp. vulgaris]